MINKSIIGVGSVSTVSRGGMIQVRIADGLGSEWRSRPLRPDVHGLRSHADVIERLYAVAESPADLVPRHGLDLPVWVVGWLHGQQVELGFAMFDQFMQGDEQ